MRGLTLGTNHGTDALLCDDVEQYVDYAAIEYVTAIQYRKSVSCYSEFLRRDAMRSDLVEAKVNKWLASKTKLAPCTIRNRKRGLTPVWNWLSERGLVAFYNSRALRRTKIKQKPVVAWSIPQVQQLIDGASDIEGSLKCGVSGANLMLAWIRVAYETGWRPSDMYVVRWDEFAGNRVTISQHKTGFPDSKVLSPDAMNALRPLRRSGCETVFILEKGGIGVWEKKLWKAAESHGFTRKKGQGSGTLRKTSATKVCECYDLSAAADFLGHVDGTSVARKHYIEPHALAKNPPPQALIDALAKPKSTGRNRRRA